MRLTTVVYQLRRLARDLREGARTLKREGGDESQVHLIKKIGADLSENAEFFRRHIAVPHQLPTDHYYEPVGVRWKRVFRIEAAGTFCPKCPHMKAACTLGTARGDKPEQCPGFSVVKLQERKD